jgi:hypothetical protein
LQRLGAGGAVAVVGQEFESLVDDLPAAILAGAIGSLLDAAQRGQDFLADELLVLQQRGIELLEIDGRAEVGQVLRSVGQVAPASPPVPTRA